LFRTSTQFVALKLQQQLVDPRRMIMARREAVSQPVLKQPAFALVVQDLT